MEEYKLSIPEYANEERLQRLKSLYSDFTRLRDTNERGYYANISWWKGVLNGGFSLIDGLTFRFDDAYLRIWEHTTLGTPHALAAVIVRSQNSMVDDGILLPLTEFLSSQSNTLSKQKSLLNMPLEWLFSSLGLGQDEGAQDGHSLFVKAKGSYIFKDRVRNLADSLVDEHMIEPSTRRLYSRRDFSRKYSLNGLDTEVVLKWLINDGKVIVDGDAVKFVIEPSEKIINKVDMGVISMNSALGSISSQVDELEGEINRHNENISTHIKNKETDKAKRALRSRKALQELLSKRLDSKENLQGVLLKIEQSVGDIEIMKAYETSNDTLKTLLKAPELDRDRVENTMDSLSDTLADHNEIEQAIARPGGAEISTEMEDEIEAEYRQLFEESKKSEETVEETPQELPSPPTNEPLEDKIALTN
ncbi:hypothetical protein E3Q22_02947 [Wallemia mellicola]|uniref:Snf7-domain-containing protein n=1 Tax=Wallemia mellicola TaxID=1708541 RepID=A0A4T0M528_9BASI|nr:hypothetical protein E3Q22_02947 [Wallemia mellicola]TIB98946.1 hypothetical protein E3Q17_02775 [Wallemia mellicola]TIC10446.1 hypothetical protein E3Q14_02811 [Wallemia mellicola]TIC29207.1 hypothetical protein E3Q10_02742 [Wallemia mellicola]